MNNRRSGILMHISSLYGKEGIGTIGEEAYRFVDFLSDSRQSLWQILPLGPTGFGNSPYSSFSAFAGNPLFINLEHLYFDLGLHLPENQEEQYDTDNDIDFNKVKASKTNLLKKAAEFYHFESTADKTDYLQFLNENNYWIESYALFTALKEHFYEVSFLDFDEGIKLRKEEELEKYKMMLSREIEIIKNIQFFFFVQWKKLKAYANQKGIEIVGDIPIYVAGDSADVWEHHELFLLDEHRNPLKVAGVPPDIFSATGQLWGNPIYNWEKLKQTSYHWWIERLKMNFKLFDIVRIDHFRGFAEYWSIPAGDKTAEFGEWIEGPGYEFFDAMFRQIGTVNIIAEDLGLITPSVAELLEKCNFPGMKILQFAFDSGEQNDFLPHRYPRNCVVYTGTHDNDTVNGWYQKLDEKSKTFFSKYYTNLTGEAGPTLVKYAWASVADIVFAPIQDVLNLDSMARMNFPGRTEDNWKWRLKPNELKPEHAKFLKELCEIYERTPVVFGENDKQGDIST